MSPDHLCCPANGCPVAHLCARGKPPGKYQEMFYVTPYHHEKGECHAFAVAPYDHARKECAEFTPGNEIATHKERQDELL